jgi:hypothetical protein
VLAVHRHSGRVALVTRSGGGGEGAVKKNDRGCNAPVSTKVFFTRQRERERERERERKRETEGRVRGR